MPIEAVSLTEYKFDHPAIVPGGRLILEVRNDGKIEHSMTLIRLPDNFDKPVEALFDGESRVFPTVTQVLPRPPGGHATQAVDLTAGRYAMICFIRDADGIAHYKKGMASEIRVADEISIPKNRVQP